MTIKEMVLYFVVYMFEGALLWKYCETLFGIEKKVQKLLLISVGYCLLFMVAIHKSPFMNAVIFMLANSICVCILYKVKWYTALFHAFILSVAMGVGELSAFCITLPISPMFSTFTPFFNLLLNACFSKLIYLAVLFFVLRILKDHNERQEKFGYIIVLASIVPFMSVIIILMLLFFVVYSHPENRVGFIIMISTIFISAFNLIVAYMYHYILKRNIAYTSLRLQLQRENDLADYYRMLIQKNEDRNILVHDMKKHLQTVLILNERKEYDKVNRYINQIIQKTALDDTVYVSDNELLNAIVNRYQKECSANHIAFYTDIRSNTICFMKESELTALFCNLLDNAVEAALGQENAFVELNLDRKENTDFIIITMINSCAKDPFSCKGNKLISKKQDKEQHGFGIKSIKRIVNAYQGKMQMYYNEENRTFHVIIMLKKG